MEPTTREAFWKNYDELFDKAEEIQTTLESTIDLATGRTDPHKLLAAQAGIVRLMDIANGFKELLIQTEIDEANELRAECSRLQEEANKAQSAAIARLVMAEERRAAIEGA